MSKSTFLMRAVLICLDLSLTIQKGFSQNLLALDQFQQMNSDS